MASLEQFEELKSLILGVDKKVTVFSEQLTKVERNLTSMIHEVKADAKVLNVKFETSQKEIKTLRHDFTELERGVQGMDLQLQELENDKLFKQKIDLQQQIDELKEKAILLEKHDRKYNILIYGIDDSNPEENVYATTRKLFSEKLLRDAPKANSMPLANPHRVPTHGKGPTPILVRFVHFGDKQLVMSKAYNLKGTKIRLLDDLPVSMKEERFLLSHNAFTIRKRDKVQTRIRAKDLKRDELGVFLRDRGIPYASRNKEDRLVLASIAEKRNVPLKTSVDDDLKTIIEERKKKMVLEDGLIKLPDPVKMLAGWEKTFINFPNTSATDVEDYIKLSETMSVVPVESVRSNNSGKSGSISSSAMARKRVNAEVQRTKLQYAEQQTKLIKQKARLSELETQSKALKDREKAEVDADLALLKQQTEAAVAEVEVKVLEEAESDRRSLSLQEDKVPLQKVKMTLTEKYVNEQFNEVEQLKSQDKNNNVPQDIPNNQDKFSSHIPAPRNQLNIIPTPRNLPKFQVDDLDRSIVEDIKPEIRQKQTLNPYAADFELTQPPLPPNHDQSVVSDLTKKNETRKVNHGATSVFNRKTDVNIKQKEEKETYTMSSCAGRTIMNGRCAESLIVESLSGNGELEIHSVIECSAIPDEKSEIPTPDIAKSYPHLREIAHQMLDLNPNIDIQLLIGRDVPEAHHVFRQLTGPKGTPFAQELFFGWVIIGDVCLGKVHKPNFVNVNKTNVMNNGRGTIFEPVLTLCM
ncbi:unnamed protein product [Mytilus edulis]|uniref:Uncharacterized protein n=1 Tax=Mytilus edulis TaxID=6550 RepID=A0A8S3T251_MYTED|nr:unnamed protein product [Mytilus edulis]